MHFHSLELFGFKSFADKTILEFHEGITAIVGPNGCGKSNVLDAIRWVLGEQSAKSLRGSEMADVIFNGSDSRKPLGFGEVSITLTDCAANLGVDWHDVRVTRRIYRDGNSEYFLNKTPCRLRDIHNLFADTGVGRSAYSMMEQGKIDLILSSRPEDRRAVFEEAAGITKYKSQKREAMRKLEATEANLLRVSDIIKEVKRQIGSLQRQAGKARRYQALMADLQVLDTYQSSKRLREWENALASCREKIGAVSDTERKTREAIDERERGLADERLALDGMDAEIAAVRGEVEQLQSEIGSHRHRIEFNRQRADEITELISRAQTEIAAAEAKRAQQQSEMQELNAQIEKTSAAITARKAELQQLSDAAAKLRTDRAGRDEELKAIEQAAAKAENRIATLEDDLSGIRARRDATAEHLKTLDAEIEAALRTRDQAQHALTEARTVTEGERKNVDDLLREANAAETLIPQHRQKLTQAEQALLAAQRSLAEKESRLEVLRQLNEEGEGLTQGSQAVLRGSEEFREFHSAVAGSLVAQLDVDPKFVPAIEAALGRNLHAVVLQSGEHAAEILHRLHRKKLGHAALLIPELSGTATTPVSPSSLPAGATAWAADKVVAPQGLESLVARLLHNVAIFDTLEHGLTAKKSDSQIAVATLSGEFISIEGIIFGGSSSGQQESLLERKSRISALATEHSALTSDVHSFRQTRDLAAAETENHIARVDDLRGKHRAAELAQSAATTRIAILEREGDIAAARLDDLRTEQSTLTQQITAADERITLLEGDLAEARKAFAVEEERRHTAEGARETAAAEEAHALEQLSELRLNLATEQQRHDNLVAQRQPMAARDAELHELIVAREADIQNYERRVQQQAEESKSAENAIAGQTARQEERRKTLSALSGKRSGAAQALNAAESELREIRDSLDELHEQRAAEQVRESQLQMKIDNLVDHVQRRYHVDLRSHTADEFAFRKTLHAQLKRREKTEAEPVADTASAAAPSEEPATEIAEQNIDKLIGDLTQQLDNMGPVNLEAVQEYDELEQRYQFLEKQNNDLTTARRELLDVIAKINATTKTLFAETFAQVRTNFREMFAELFGGGRADLSLMDDSDPLNCGIEISAKPPGKQQQVISLLSGGERTMTAVALLFAIYMVRPSPFCVLDEMDAALDESNINRFIRVLERFVEQSQFIIITHNKRTIAKADVIYGVTMAERGISKLVGMKLAERPENYSEPPSNGLSNGNGNGGLGTQQRSLNMDAAREPALLGTH